MRELVLERIAGLVEERYPGEPAAPAESAIERAAHAVLGDESDAAAAAALARRGYLARVVEAELFEGARQPAAELRAALAEAAPDDPLAALGTVAGALARAEPAERPDPGDDRSFSWRVPGPGGHVRHYLALGAVRKQTGRPPAAQAAGLKRCWLYGFYVRCCEEAVEE